MYRFLVAILFISLFLVVFPITVTNAAVLKESTIKNDSSKIAVRNFDAQKIKAYSQQTEFIYKDILPADITIWTRFWNWFWSLTDHLFEGKYSGKIIKYAIIIALVILFVFVATKITGLDLGIFSGKSRSLNVPYIESLDNINEINFNNEISKAIAIGNYRLAVRLFYLSSLKKLNDKNLISWQPEKTNQTYISEIKDLSKRQRFKLLTTQFEYIWYGDFSIDEENFNKVKASFEIFNKETT